ncbi:hypothetical protein ACHAXS_005355 [Conticribra weissflogii]
MKLWQFKSKSKGACSADSTMTNTERKHVSKLLLDLSGHEEEMVVNNYDSANYVNRHKSYVNAVDGMVEDNEHADLDMSVVEWMSGSICNGTCGGNPCDDFIVVEDRGAAEISPYMWNQGNKNKRAYFNKAMRERVKRDKNTNNKSSTLVPDFEPALPLERVGDVMMDKASSAKTTINQRYNGLIRTYEDVIEVTNERIDAIDTVLDAVCGIELDDDTTWLSESYMNRKRLLYSHEQSTRQNHGDTVVGTLVRSSWTAIVESREKELKRSDSDFSSRDGMYSL